MNYSLFILPRAQKELAQLNAGAFARVRDAIRELAVVWHAGVREGRQDRLLLACGLLLYLCMGGRRGWHVSRLILLLTGDYNGEL